MPPMAGMLLWISNQKQSPITLLARRVSGRRVAHGTRAAVLMYTIQEATSSKLLNRCWLQVGVCGVYVYTDCVFRRSSVVGFDEL